MSQRAEGAGGREREGFASNDISPSHKTFFSENCCFSFSTSVLCFVLRTGYEAKPLPVCFLSDHLISVLPFFFFKFPLMVLLLSFLSVSVDFHLFVCDIYFWLFRVLISEVSLVLNVLFFEGSALMWLQQKILFET